jgi:hypothetical protein
MAELNTKATKASVVEFLNSVEHETRRKDGFILLEMMQRISGFEPRMWGGTMVGFGGYHYKYESGREGDVFQIGFSPRKQSLSVYLTCDIQKWNALLSKLGKHKTGKGCLYINKLSDVNLTVLEELIKESLEFTLNEKSE